jgi:hypothetical protein
VEVELVAMIMGVAEVLVDIELLTQFQAHQA